jgi:hypothetical protein
MYEKLTLYGVVMSKIEKLPRYEGDKCSSVVDVAIHGHGEQTMTTVPMRTTDSEGPIVFEAEVPYGFSRGNYRGQGFPVHGTEHHQPTIMDETVVSIRTSDLSLLKLLNVGAQVSVQVNGDDYKLAQSDDNGFHTWEVLKPEA